MKRILDDINGPEDLKKLPLWKLKILAKEIREEIIQTVSKTGGHLAANLGVIELTIALLYVFDFPKDKVIWDVGHQCYTYKILTGRKDKFNTLRQFGGLSGFPCRSECLYDAFGTGHSSTSVSAGAGIATGLKLDKKNDNTIAVIGDGALTAGMSFEGLNFSGHIRSNLKVIVNDNAMSISPNVGALGGYLSRITTAPWYNRMRSDMEKRLKEKSPGMLFALKKMEESLKTLFTPGVLFEELGFRYFGPIDGHDINILITTFNRIKNFNGPILVHILTKKGKGYLPAESNPERFHGIGKFDPVTGGDIDTGKKKKTFTDVFSEAIIKLARENDKIVALTAAMPDGTGLSDFAKEFPERFYDVGIAEQNAATFAAGLACGGYKPIVAIYSTFLQRAYDQVIHDVCIQNLPVIFCLDRAGIVGADGVTHQGIFDISFLRLVPNITIMVPKDENELLAMLKTALALNRPVVIRYPRGEVRGNDIDKIIDIIPFGRAEILKEGYDAVILAVGPIVYDALTVSDEFERQGKKIGVVNMRFVKPLDRELIKEVCGKTKNILTLEENVLAGGFGSAVLEVISEEGLSVKTALIGLPDTFIEHGSQGILREKYGLDKKHIMEKLEILLKSGNNYAKDKA
ncbi:MAG: 1-deoxy-D-xylulose-5-phosphate synthase [bacterium]|nr:1-deoxy-D-xylulose-5-phosphate synthase [bacterium]